MKTKGNVFGIGILLLSLVNSGRAQTWTLTSAPATNWSAVASSADGSKVVASVIGGLIYVSSNFGSTWLPSSAPSNAWSAVASSADGIKLVAVANPGAIYYSSNSGANWTQADAPITNWTGVACSADGKTMLTTHSVYGTPGGVLVSSNSGVSWTQMTAPKEHWFTVALSANGATLAVGAGTDTNYDYGHIHVSTNFGESWIQTDAPRQTWTSIASSADGRKLASAARGRPGGSPVTYTVPEPISISSDSGGTWMQTSVTDDWVAIAASADGTKLVAATGGRYRPIEYPDGGVIRISTNSGASWITTVVPHASWTGVTGSADGANLVAVAGSFPWGDVPVPGIYTMRSTPSASLVVTGSADGVNISWLVPSVDLVLEQNSDLGTTNWTEVAATPTLNYADLHYQVSIPPPSGRMFYRLRSR